AKAAPSGIRTLRSPSPLPSPSGRGRTNSQAATTPNGSRYRMHGPQCSLSLRERAGVRGNGPWKLQMQGILQLPFALRNSDLFSLTLLSAFDLRISDLS